VLFRSSLVVERADGDVVLVFFDGPLEGERVPGVVAILSCRRAAAEALLQNLRSALNARE
jgi:hypothetical protein